MPCGLWHILLSNLRPSPASPCCYQQKPDPHLKSSSLLAQKRNLNNSPFLNKKSYQLAWQKKMMSTFLFGLETSTICECYVPSFKHLIKGWRRWLLGHTQCCSWIDISECLGLLGCTTRLRYVLPIPMEFGFWRVCRNKSGCYPRSFQLQISCWSWRVYCYSEWSRIQNPT